MALIPVAKATISLPRLASARLLSAEGHRPGYLEMLSF